MEALRVERLSKHFGGLEILKDLSFNVQSGEHVAIIGPNGAGKTTLFNVISGTLLPSSGRLWMFGQDITHRVAYERVHLGLGRSFQITTLLSDLSLLENVLLALLGVRPSRYGVFRSIHSYGEIVREAEELLISINHYGARNEPVRTLSYGDQRKLEIILSLASKPKLLLLDEPTAGLALSEVPPFIETIKTLAAGTTVLLTSHDMDVVFGLADRIVVLYFGQFVSQGTAEEIQANPKVKEIYLGMEEDTENVKSD